VRKAVKWNSPFYGIEDHGWFLSYHCFDQYLKVTFFRGRSLDPCAAGESKHPQVRYLDIRENEFDAAQFVDWVKQAASCPAKKCEVMALRGNSRRQAAASSDVLTRGSSG
jgi:hypothetical protein